MNETVFVFLVAFVHDAKNSCTCADLAGRIFFKIWYRRLPSPAKRRRYPS